MRVISGSRRGRKLISFEGDSIRPTTDRVKEAIFNLIWEFVPKSRVLDLFGGSGALAVEALSRGAEGAVIVDKSKASVDVILKNLDITGFLDKADVRLLSAQEFLDSCDRKFDIIFLDPPYNKGFALPVLMKISEKELLTDEGIVVLESDSGDAFGEIDGMEILKERKYGRTYVTIYKRKSE